MARRWNMPESEIRCSGLAIVVRTVRNLRRNGDELWGYWNPTANLIELESKQERQRAARTLLHEVAHAVGVDTDNATDEDRADLFAQAVASLICESPRWVRWIRESDR